MESSSGWPTFRVMGDLRASGIENIFFDVFLFEASISDGNHFFALREESTRIPFVDKSQISWMLEIDGRDIKSSYSGEYVFQVSKSMDNYPYRLCKLYGIFNGIEIASTV